jgi:hypothetical protein
MKIWLDDDRPAPEGWVWVQTALEAIDYLKRVKTGILPSEAFSHMSFDHDLADVHYEYFMAGQVLPEGHAVRAHAKRESAKEMTGYDVILWMAEHEVWPTEDCYVHTHNSVRGPVMADMINRYGPYEHRIVWSPYVPPAPKEIQA